MLYLSEIPSKEAKICSRSDETDTSNAESYKPNIIHAIQVTNRNFGHSVTKLKLSNLTKSNFIFKQKHLWTYQHLS